MNKLISIFTVTLLLATVAVAQARTNTRGSAQTETKADAQANAQGSGQSTTLASGTELSAELLSTLDAKQAKPGDEFRLRTLKPVVVDGKRVVDKGATLVGRVTESTQAEGKQGVSQLKLTFDQLKNRNLTLPFSATLEQITQAAASNQTQFDDSGASTQTQTSTSSRTTTSSGSNGGLLGGVTNTVGGVVGGTVNTASNTVGSVGGVGNTVGGMANTTHQTLGQVIATSSSTVNNTAAGAGQATRMISISSDTNAEASGSSTLSLMGRNVRVEKGSVFWLRTDKALTLTPSK